MSVAADSELAAQIAHQAGQLLLSVRSSGLTGKELGKAGDQQSNEMILARLAVARPDDAVLSEESADSPARLSADRVWIVDPLDGTREFGLPGRNDWAVHVALWERSAIETNPSGLTASAVAQPALDAVYATTAAAVVPPAVDRAPVILVSDSRPPAWAPEVAAAVGGVVQPMGSAGAKAMAVGRGEADAYLHAGGQWEWDSAAPVGVLAAAGFHTSRIDGSPLLYNQAHPYLPDLVMCRPELAAPLLAALAGL
ncbi:MAG TPA: 3'(2'),5'-bisphosphate nucleotidase CysQ [Acidimicrobiales bacterium]|jgi:3'(2'), 5'-bisphosphate nucleotidase|nr:3'(2'),5'-bisphosphate nucleotidase CysQ [Acidimicrobiales bacterium]